MSAPWWAAFGPADTEVSCGAGTHVVRWTDGSLHAVDHPDAEGESVLAALGGEAAPCLELVKSWGQHSDDLMVLAVGPRSADDTLAITTDWLDESGPGRGFAARSGWSGFVPLQRQATATTIARYSLGSSGGGVIRRHGGARAVGRRSGLAAAFGGRGLGGVAFRHRGWNSATGASRLVASAHSSLVSSSLVSGWTAYEPDPQAGLFRVLALGLPFQLRLAAAVAQAWSADGQHSSRRKQAAPALAAALAGRLAPAAAHWLGIDPGKVDASIHDAAGWGQVRLIGADRLDMRLPLSWLADVWAPELAVVHGHLVVDVLSAAWPAASVLALTSPGTEPVELSVRHAGQYWSIAA